MRTAARRSAPALVLFIVLTASSASAEDVIVRTPDGVALRGVWQSPAQQAPAILLVHSYLRSHADWDVAAGQLHDAGFGVLAVDLRGHGSSPGSLPSDSLQPLVVDVKAALAWLRAEPTVNASKLGVAGLSLGTTLALLASGPDTSVKSLALVSPAMEFRGLRVDTAMHAFAGRSGAALLIAGALDPYGARCARQLAEVQPGLRDLQLVDGSPANGRTLLAEHPDLVATLVDWFRRTLL